MAAKKNVPKVTKLKKSFELHEKLKKKLSDDLVYSLVYDHGQYMLAVSVHNSKTLKFNHNRKIQVVKLADDDLEVDLNLVVDETVRILKEILVEKEEDVGLSDVTAELDAINKEYAAKEVEIVYNAVKAD